MNKKLKPRVSARRLLVVALFVFGVGCTPIHTVKPLPNFVDKAIQPGDKVIVTTTVGETYEFVVTEVSNETLIGKNHRVALKDIATLKKVSWHRPPSHCGGDQSLGCSVPLLVSLASDVHAHFGRFFYDACAQHDYCYRHGQRTYGLDREACDTEFLENMRNLCPEPSRSKFQRFLDSINTDTDSGKACLSTAETFHAVVERFGEDKFQTDISTYCEYDGPPTIGDLPGLR